MLNRIRIFSTEKFQVRSFCITAYLPSLDIRDDFTKDCNCDIPSLPGDPDYVYYTDYRSMQERAPERLRKLRAQRPVALAINALLDIPGITRVLRFDYELRVTKVAAFDWPDCQNAIVEAIKTHLFPPGATVEVQDCTKTKKEQESPKKSA